MALVLAPEPPLSDWLAALDAQIARAPSFFDARPVLLDLAALPREQPDVAGLIGVLAARGIRIIGTEGAHPSWEGVEQWGGPIGTGSKGPGRPMEVPDEHPPAAPAAAGEAAALVIDHSIRSGQSIVHEQGDVTIIGAVAWGAEIVAGGSIHVYGALRGRAIAGLSGNKGARIFCRKLEAELLAIEGVYKTADDMDRALHGRAAQAWLNAELDDDRSIGLKGETMAQVVVVTSGKGGVGKTTSTAALGAALAQSGESVVVVDFDVGLRNLDLVMGAERRVVFDLINVVQGDAKLAQALIRDKRLENLSLLPASQTRDKEALTPEGVERVIGELREKFDWILCDSPAGIERGATMAMRHADSAVVVTNAEVSSVRDSDRIIGLLDAKTERAERGQKMPKHLLLTRYDAARAARGEMLKTEDVLEILSIPLLGIIPESQEVLRSSNLGSPVTLSNPTSAPARAYAEAARRLKGEQIQVSIPVARRSGFISKLFGRGAVA